MGYYSPNQNGDLDAQKKGTAESANRLALALALALALHLGRPAPRGWPQTFRPRRRGPAPSEAGASGSASRSRDAACAATGRLPPGAQPLPARARGARGRFDRRLPRHPLLGPGRPRPPARRSARQGRAFARHVWSGHSPRESGEPRPRPPGSGLGGPLPLAGPDDPTRGASLARLHSDELQETPARGRVEGTRPGPELPARGVGDRPLLVGPVVRRVAASARTAATRRPLTRRGSAHLVGPRRVAAAWAHWSRRTAAADGAARSQSARRRRRLVALRAESRQPQRAPASEAPSRGVGFLPWPLPARRRRATETRTSIPDEHGGLAPSSPDASQPTVSQCAAR